MVTRFLKECRCRSQASNSQMNPLDHERMPNLKALLQVVHDRSRDVAKKKKRKTDSTLPLLVFFFVLSAILLMSSTWSSSDPFHIIGAVWPVQNRQMSIKVAQKRIGTLEKWKILTPSSPSQHHLRYNFILNIHSIPRQCDQIWRFIGL